MSVHNRRNKWSWRCRGTCYVRRSKELSVERPGPWSEQDTIPNSKALNASATSRTYFSE
ncbi:hypothetical protein FA13DRAFT_1737490 [Coprinellus micaceus]|uniref:Uncharacterized protein n=1 Tax=Coprinellus micaceus TaxID=71717 RepID=A0A4Y7SWS5_COPMI|nr:hypothetical protein FA13DRAFT_1737490 [Coprinellus micaceus]